MFGAGADPRVVSARLASVLIIMASSLDLLAITWTRVEVAARIILDVIGIALAGIAFLVPWHELPRRAQFAFAPFCLTLIALGATLGGMEPFAFVAYLMLFYAWIGVALPRGSAALITPLALLAYLIPVGISSFRSSMHTAGVVLPIGILIGESIAIGIETYRRQEERSRTIAGLTSDIAFVARFGDDGAIEGEWLTDPSSRLVGFAPGEDVLDWLRLVHPDDIPTLAASRSRLQAGRADTIEFRIIHPTLGTRWFERTARPEYAEDGSIAGYLGSARDITDRKLAQEERHLALERALAAAEHLRTLEGMKAAFVTAASHELRTSITSIIGIARTLEEHGARLTADEQLDLLRRMTANGERLEQMFRGLMGLDGGDTGRAPGRLEPAQLSTIADNAVTQVDLDHHHLAAIDVHDTTVVTDGSSVERILTNLLWYAVRHTPAGSHIWLRMHARGETLDITVEDDGPGVPEALKAGIFQPSQQPPAHRAGDGAGVGLGLVQRFASLLGGRAWYEDRPGGGACFRVSIPVEATATAALTAAAAAEAQTSVRSA